MSFTTEHLPGVCAQPSDATRGFVFNHSMLRVKDPAVALDFYTRVMGMRLLLAVLSGPPRRRRSPR